MRLQRGGLPFWVLCALLFGAYDLNSDHLDHRTIALSSLWGSPRDLEKSRLSLRCGIISAVSRIQLYCIGPWELNGVL